MIYCGFARIFGKVKSIEMKICVFLFYHFVHSLIMNDTDMNALSKKIQDIQASISKLAQGRSVRLVAVSKTKPESDIQRVYDCGIRHFGENYV